MKMNDPGAAASATPAKDTLYYDGACGLCIRSTRWLRRFDWLGRLAFRDMTASSDDDLPVSFETAMQGLPMRTRDGRVLVGYPAVRRALLQTPPGFLPALVMYLPGVSHIGRRIYRRIASGRNRSVACKVDHSSQAPADDAEAR